MKKNITISSLIIFVFLLLNCTKSQLGTNLNNNINTVVSQLGSCSDTIYIGDFIATSPVTINWGGVTYYQARVNPYRSIMPYKTHRVVCPDKRRGGILIADTIPIFEGDRFVLTKIEY